MAGASLKMALIVNFTIGVIKTLVGFLTSSAAMLAEALHSFADTFNQILLALGIRNSKKKPDLEHPFGYQKNQFFWSFVVAVLIFGISGALAVYHGVEILRDPHGHHIETDLFIWNLVVLGVAIILEAFAFKAAYDETNAYKEEMEVDSFVEALDEMQDPVLLSLLVEDSLALLGLVIAFVGTLVVYFTEDPVVDGFTSLLIGVVLMIGGLLLARENKTYLIGKSVSQRVQDLVKATVEGHESVVEMKLMRTMLLGPKTYIVALDIVFKDGDDAEMTDSLEQALIKAVPELKARKIFIESQKADTRGKPVSEKKTD